MLLVLAITVDSGRSLEDLEVLFLAGLVGVLAFLTWTWTDRTSRHGIARRADERLGLDGGLLAAFENAGRPERPMAELGARRTLGRVPFNRLRAAAVPPFEVFLVLPLLGGVALFRSIEARDDAKPTSRAMVAQVNDLAGGLQRATAEHQGELSQSQIAELVAAVGAAQEVARSAEEGPMGEAMRDVASALDQAAASLPDGSPLGEALERLAFEAEAASVDSSPVGEDSGGASSGTKDPDQELASEPEARGPDSSASFPGELADAGGAALPGVNPTGGQDGDRGGPDGLGTADDSGAAGEAASDGHPVDPDGANGGLSRAADPGPDPSVPEAPAPTTAAPAPWWAESDDELVRAWLGRVR